MESLFKEHSVDPCLKLKELKFKNQRNIAQKFLWAKFMNIGLLVKPEMTLLKSQQNFQTHLKSNFLFIPISNKYTSKGFQDDWSQVNNRHTFTDRHLLIPIK